MDYPEKLLTGCSVVATLILILPRIFFAWVRLVRFMRPEKGRTKKLTSPEDL
jgi:hypothetical protein